MDTQFLLPAVASTEDMSWGPTEVELFARSAIPQGEIYFISS